MKTTFIPLALAVALLTGCAANVPSGIDPAYHAVDTAMLGEWNGPNNTTVEIEHLGGSAFELEVSDAKDEATYRGHLLDISGKKFAEVSVFQPDQKTEVPVYLYAMVEVSGDTMVHKPIKAEWLAEQSRNLPSAIYRSTADEQPGSGGVVVRDRAAMLELLRKASTDPSAFGATETLTRKKK
ncbi:MAG: hypothetical protein GIKADHBN_01733 [Phycisphaerales bacterium]|nr:hypothetical protein [Phycisphaerales bacterium]